MLGWVYQHCNYEEDFGEMYCDHRICPQQVDPDDPTKVIRDGLPCAKQMNVKYIDSGGARRNADGTCALTGGTNTGCVDAGGGQDTNTSVSVIEIGSGGSISSRSTTSDTVQVEEDASAVARENVEQRQRFAADSSSIYTLAGLYGSGFTVREPIPFTIGAGVWTRASVEQLLTESDARGHMPDSTDTS